MIKYLDSNINKWYNDDSELIKVYYHGAICYYKVDSSSPSGQTPCFAVVADITQYSDTEFEDVFNKADGKWYKLNNLNQYEEYGVYASGRTSCESSSRLPQGYTEVEYIENTGTSSSNGAYLNLGLPLYDTIGNSFIITSRLKSEYYSASGDDVLETIINSEGVLSPYYGFVYRYAYSTHNIELASSPSNHATLSTTANTDGTASITISCNSTSVTDQVPLGLFASYNANYNTPYRFAKATIYSLTVVKNGDTVRDLVPAKRDSDNKYGMYDLVTDTFYLSPNGNNFIGGEPISPTECVTTYEGKLTIDGDYEYQYSGSSWVNLGEVSGSTIDTIWIDPPNTNNQNASFDIGHYWGEGYKMVFNAYLSGSYSSDVGSFWQYNDHSPIELSFYANGFYYDFHDPTSTTAPNVNTSDYNWRIMKNGTLNSYQNGQIFNVILTNGTVRVELEDGTAIVTGSTSTSAQNWYNGLYQPKFGIMSSSNKCHASRIQVYNANNELVNDIKFIKSQGITGSQEISAYDSVLDVTYNNTNSYTPSYHVVTDSGGTEYPVYYDEMQDPPNNLSFSSMTEAEEYECPWVGMNATIDVNNYIFSGDSQSGYEWVYNPSRLPVGYTEVEYIENTTHAYLDIGFVPNQDTRIVCDMQQVTANDYPRLWGAGNWDSANGINLNYEGGYLQMSWFGKTSWTKFTSVPTNYNRHIYDLNKNYLYVDETLIGSNTYTTKTAAASIGIFCEIKNNGQPPTSTNNPKYWEGEYFKGKMFSFQIYDNGTLVRDLVPCIKDSNNTVGAYDIVNDVFYTVPTGYTTDKLVAGNPI